MLSPVYPTLAINSVSNISNVAQENFHDLKKGATVQVLQIETYLLGARFVRFF